MLLMTAFKFSSLVVVDDVNIGWNDIYFRATSLVWENNKKFKGNDWKRIRVEIITEMDVSLEEV